MESLQETDYYDLATSEGKEQYCTALEARAETWAANFEELGGGDGEPYQIGQGDDLWIDIVERWDDEFGDYAVSDIDVAQQIGEPVCERVIIALVAKRRDD